MPRQTWVCDACGKHHKSYASAESCEEAHKKTGEAAKIVGMTWDLRVKLPVQLTVKFGDSPKDSVVYILKKT